MLRGSLNENFGEMLDRRQSSLIHPLRLCRIRRGLGQSALRACGRLAIRWARFVAPLALALAVRHRVVRHRFARRAVAAAILELGLSFRRPQQRHTRVDRRRPRHHLVRGLLHPQPLDELRPLGARALRELLELLGALRREAHRRVRPILECSVVRLGLLEQIRHRLLRARALCRGRRLRPQSVRHTSRSSPSRARRRRCRRRRGRRGRRGRLEHLPRCERALLHLPNPPRELGHFSRDLIKARQHRRLQLGHIRPLTFLLEHRSRPLLSTVPLPLKELLVRRHAVARQNRTWAREARARRRRGSSIESVTNIVVEESTISDLRLVVSVVIIVVAESRTESSRIHQGIAAATECARRLLVLSCLRRRRGGRHIARVRIHLVIVIVHYLLLLEVIEQFVIIANIVVLVVLVNHVCAAGEFHVLRRVVAQRETADWRSAGGCTGQTHENMIARLGNSFWLLIDPLRPAKVLRARVTPRLITKHHVRQLRLSARSSGDGSAARRAAHAILNQDVERRICMLLADSAEETVIVESLRVVAAVDSDVFLGQRETSGTDPIRKHPAIAAALLIETETSFRQPRARVRLIGEGKPHPTNPALHLLVHRAGCLLRARARAPSQITGAALRRATRLSEDEGEVAPLPPFNSTPGSAPANSLLMNQNGVDGSRRRGC